VRSYGRTLRKDEVEIVTDAEILAVDRRREVEIEIEIEVETETPQGQVNRQEAEEEPRWSPAKPGEPIKSEMTTGDAW
jgi:hypothetical protein